MSSVIGYLEQLGRTGAHASGLLEGLEQPLKNALVDRDAGLLRALLDVPQQFYALVAPAEPEPSRPDDAPPEPADVPARPD